MRTFQEAEAMMLAGLVIGREAPQDVRLARRVAERLHRHEPLLADDADVYIVLRHRYAHELAVLRRQDH
jgi:hypothetical protein